MEPNIGNPSEVTPGARESLEAARRRARRQLRAVLLTLAGLDAGVVILVLSLAEARSHLGLTTPELLVSILGGVGLILVVRVLLAVRLRRRSGNL
ncbi:MAG TPA: hypothetical protein VJ021_07925 [Thermoplasmata archaeon]|nr:hypothetical protein [Thermoplasmata archaeon]